MSLVRAEGVILQSVTFKEADRIITAFTADGIVKLVIKGALSRRHGRGASTAPLQLAEFAFVENQGEVGSCREIAILDPFLRLRQKIEQLESAGAMAAAVLATQQIGAAAPLLYRLLITYLRMIPSSKDPLVLAASFRLKMLRHEGILSLENSCSSCGQMLSCMVIAEGESFCLKHAPSRSFVFDEKESGLLLECAYSRSMQQLMELEAAPSFLEKVALLFSGCLKFH